jgi:hypothetical protein
MRVRLLMSSGQSVHADLSGRLGTMRESYLSGAVKPDEAQRAQAVIDTDGCHQILCLRRK